MQAGCKRMFGVGGNKQKSLILPLEAIFCSLVQFFFFSPSVNMLSVCLPIKTNLT